MPPKNQPSYKQVTDQAKQLKKELETLRGENKAKVNEIEFIKAMEEHVSFWNVCMIDKKASMEKDGKEKDEIEKELSELGKSILEQDITVWEEKTILVSEVTDGMIKDLRKGGHGFCMRDALSAELRVNLAKFRELEKTSVNISTEKSYKDWDLECETQKGLNSLKLKDLSLIYSELNQINDLMKESTEVIARANQFAPAQIARGEDIGRIADTVLQSYCMLYDAIHGGPEVDMEAEAK